MLPQLRCPWCNTQGLSHIGSHPLEQVAVIYCRKCLAIRGIIPLTGTPLPSPEEIPLRCPWCNTVKAEQIKITSLGKGWRVASCQGCGAIYGLIPLIELEPAKLAADNLSKPNIPPNVEPTTSLLQSVNDLPKPDVRSQAELAPSASPVLVSPLAEDQQLWAEIGIANLEAKRAQYEAEMKRRTIAAKRGASLYRAIVNDEGPPYCLQCHRDMEAEVVPPGYKNSGKKVWVYPNKCGAWEAS